MTDEKLLRRREQNRLAAQKWRANPDNRAKANAASVERVAEWRKNPDNYLKTLAYNRKYKRKDKHDTV